MTEPTLPATTDVVVVGAGLAGLAAAHALSATDLHVLVLEAEDHVGGRVHTDRIDGFLVDRGFQLYNPAYPEGRRVLDHDALALQPFSRGVLVSRGDRCWRLGDPRAHPTWLGDAARSPLGGVSDKARFAAYAWRTGRSTPAQLRSRPDTSTVAALRAAGLSDRFVDSVVRPFLTGVFLERDLATSRRFFDLVVRSFVRGTPSVPASGMSAIPVQLAAALPDGSLRLSTPAVSVVSGGVDTDAGTVTARAVVVATGPAAAGALLTGLAVPDCHAVTTWYHVADDAGERLVGGLPALVVDADRRGPVVNTAVMSNVAPTYSPPGRTLVSSSVLGVRDDPDTEAAVRAHLGLLYRTDTRRWETLAVRAVRHALPAMPAPHDFAKPVRLGDGLYVAGDHRDSSSIQGALVSGRRAAQAVLNEL